MVGVSAGCLGEGGGGALGGGDRVGPGEGIELRNTAGRLPRVPVPLPGVDLRGDGGYVVAPPSRHASGGAYRWVDPDAVPAPGPGWLRPSPRPVFPTGGPTRPAPKGGASRYGLAALRREVGDVRAAPVGARNNRLNRAAFSLGMLAAGGELDRAQVEDELLAAALELGLPEGEARASIRSGLRSAPPNPADGQEPEPHRPPGGGRAPVVRAATLAGAVRSEGGGGCRDERQPSRQAGHRKSWGQRRHPMGETPMTPLSN